jgi:hypothetical protein
VLQIHFSNVSVPQKIPRFQQYLRIHLCCSNVKFTNAIFFYTNYCHLTESTSTKQRALSSRSILLQSLQNTKIHPYLHLSYKHSKCVYFLGHSVQLQGYVPDGPKITKKKSQNPQCYCLKRNIQATEPIITDSITIINSKTFHDIQTKASRTDSRTVYSN